MHETVKNLLLYPVPVAFLVSGIICVIIAAFIWGRFIFQRRWERVFRKRSHSVVTGLVGEHFSILFNGFPGNPADARFIGKPVDYIVFNGLSSGNVDEIIFVEVKTHPGTRLTAAERSVRDTVRDRRVRWARFDFQERGGNGA
jgi:predicted Holliday junction resolvase-like endonuclease